ncbi:MAG: putative transcriptional regulator [Psychroserpens sp.]|jgi:putative transcriptional regulator
MTMLRILLQERLIDKAFKENRKITLNEVAKETKIGRATLTRIVNKRDYNVRTDVIDKLCEYFDCEVSEIMVRVKSQAV